MTILLDEGVPQQLTKRLPGHAVETVASMSWLGIQNGSLIKLVGQFFEIFVTADKNMMHQNSMKHLPFAMIVLSTNNWPIMRPHMAIIREAINSTHTGEIKTVDCGQFIPVKRRSS